ncbi:hypothetical protein BTVI_41648 [Pitangus sulphuratus]|nr:hypothetical protein BTVI_41648 [Pitangus sulphuratus]
MPTSSRTHFLPLAKGKPVRSDSNASVITYLRTQRENMQITVRSKKRDKQGEAEVVLAVNLLVSWKGKNRRYWRMVDSEIVWDLLLHLDPYKSMRPDGIHPRILKELADVIAKPLSVIFERSLESREVPADWKLVNIVLIFKKGKKQDPRNYRPVSLQCLFLLDIADLVQVVEQEEN